MTRAYNQEYYFENKELINQKCREYYARNREKIIKQRCL